VAIIGSLATNKYRSEIKTALAGPLSHVSSSAQQAIGNQIGGAVAVKGTLPADLRQTTTDAVNHAFVSGLHLSALVGIGIMILAMVSAAVYVPARYTIVDDPEANLLAHL
jgi:uncharacterized membrane protein YbjE (DUF340 family)